MGNYAGLHVTISHYCKVKSPVNDCKQILSSAGFVWRHKDILSVSLRLLAQWRRDGLITWRRLLNKRRGHTMSQIPLHFATAPPTRGTSSAHNRVVNATT